MSRTQLSAGKSLNVDMELFTTMGHILLLNITLNAKLDHIAEGINTGSDINVCLLLNTTMMYRNSRYTTGEEVVLLFDHTRTSVVELHAKNQVSSQKKSIRVIGEFTVEVTVSNLVSSASLSSPALSASTSHKHGTSKRRLMLHRKTSSIHGVCTGSMLPPGLLLKERRSFIILWDVDGETVSLGEDSLFDPAVHEEEGSYLTHSKAPVRIQPTVLGISLTFTNLQSDARDQIHAGGHCHSEFSLRNLSALVRLGNSMECDDRGRPQSLQLGPLFYTAERASGRAELYKSNKTRKNYSIHKGTSSWHEYNLLHNQVNYHSFNIIQQHLQQVIQFTVVFMSQPNKVLPLLLLFRMFDRPTLSMCHLHRIQRWDSSSIRITLPPSCLSVLQTAWSPCGGFTFGLTNLDHPHIGASNTSEQRACEKTCLAFYRPVLVGCEQR
ncbi:hypothetical protein Q8A73_020335 [Channa argus]|nr:hypothetical protein Q8A73_020335 [Channa argus]